MKDFGLVLGLNLVLGLSIPAIDVSAHIGGLVAGLIGGFVISKNPKWVLAYSIVMAMIMLLIMQYLPKYYMGVVG
jgi:rhomboid protease GluP